MLYIWPPEMLYICPGPSWCFMNMTIIFGVIGIIGQLVIDHIRDTIVSLTLLVGIIAISSKRNNKITLQMGSILNTDFLL